jgi:hypothetical protein
MMKLWRVFERWLDRRLLWPSILKAAPTRERAELAMLLHMDMDPAYSDMSYGDHERYVKRLP